MKSCGVIVEYNPFHAGHKYHLSQARQISGADVVVAVMSGNFLQRGEPAIINKWLRAEEALKQGADLVIELPFAYAVQSADYFATGAVKLLQGLEVENLCFGTDNQEDLDYQGFAAFHQEHLSEIETTFKALKNNGMSYPQQMTAVYRQLYPEWQLDFTSPNHILGMAYAKANQVYQRPMNLYPIQRAVANHHEEKIHSQEFASGTAIRQAAFRQELSQVEKVVTAGSFASLAGEALISWEAAWPLLKYQLLTRSLTDLKEIYQMVEGLEYRLKEQVNQAKSFEEFVSLVKTKRFTWTRIQRLCTYVLLNVKQAEIEAVWENSYLRVLGFTEKGREFLSLKGKGSSLPLISNVSQKTEQQVALDIRAGQVYQLFSRDLPEQDYYRKPLYLKKD